MRRPHHVSYLASVVKRFGIIDGLSDTHWHIPGTGAYIGCKSESPFYFIMYFRGPLTGRRVLLHSHMIEQELRKLIEHAMDPDINYDHVKHI